MVAANQVWHRMANLHPTSRRLQGTGRDRTGRTGRVARGRAAVAVTGLGPSLLAALMLTAWIAPVRALECPVAHIGTAPTAIKESPQQIRELSSLLSAQGTGAAADIISYVRRAHPGASDAEVTNYLVTAYCPVIEQNQALSETEKRARLESFSSRLMREMAK